MALRFLRLLILRRQILAIRLCGLRSGGILSVYLSQCQVSVRKRLSHGLTTQSDSDIHIKVAIGEEPALYTHVCVEQVRHSAKTRARKLQ